jgi:NAD(P)-dependent dehydrogenase (short-subunit alcohol dehydrogenase family)
LGNFIFFRLSGRGAAFLLRRFTNLQARLDAQISSLQLFSLCDLVQADVDAAAVRLALPPERVLAVRADVTSEPDVAELFQSTLDKFSRLDVLVNNAGFAWPRVGPVNLALADTPLDVWRKIIDTNLTGTFLCSREALKMMRVQDGGAIINISSPQGKRASC